MSTKIEKLEWHRSKVIEIGTRGLSQTEIAHELQVSKVSIILDMQYLRTQAKESIREYVIKHLSEQYQVCLSALDTILKHAFDILEISTDNREKLQAMELLKDIHKSGVTVKCYHNIQRFELYQKQAATRTA